MRYELRVSRPFHSYIAPQEMQQRYMCAYKYPNLIVWRRKLLRDGIATGWLSVRLERFRLYSDHLMRCQLACWKGRKWTMPYPNLAQKLPRQTLRSIFLPCGVVLVLRCKDETSFHNWCGCSLLLWMCWDKMIDGSSCSDMRWSSFL